MKELFIKYFIDASSYQSIEPTCFNLTEYTETWLINHKKQLTIPRVVNCKHEDYTPCYGREGELMFKQCDTCGEEFD